MVRTRSRHRDQLLLSLASALADYPRASMEQLAKTVGISRATLTRHFSTREVMIQAISEAAIISAEQAFERARPHEGVAEQAIKRLLGELLPIAELYTYAYHDETDQVVQARAEPLRESMIALFQQWQNAGQIRIDSPALWLVESMSALLRSAATLIRSGRLARHDAIENIFCVFWQGVHKSDLTR